MYFNQPPTIADIARGLATVPRWNGQTVLDKVGHRWSVLQHCLAGMACTADPMEQLIFALHDAEEMVTGDTPKPYKTREQSALGDEIRDEIFRGLGLPLLKADERALVRVKEIDDRVRIAEAHVLCHPVRRAHAEPSVEQEWFPDTVNQVWGLIGIPPHIAIDLYVDAVEAIWDAPAVRQLRRRA